MKKYLLDELTEYTESDAYPLHMPGHKRQMRLFEHPYEIDITEIEGFDNLHHPEGILKDAQDRAAGLYGADETFFLVNGSTGGILAAVSAAVPRGGRILMARNSHKSAYHAALVNDLHVTWLYPDMDERRGIYGSIRPEQVREALEGSGAITAVLITSPTYDGVVSDIRSIADEAHRAGAVLIVDEAHGAHFAMHPYFPESALALGADLVINSLHKTMPSLTQTALLHVKGDRVSRERLRFFLDVYQSSSPSYVLMTAMDECVRLMESGRQELFADFVRRLECLRRTLGGMRVLHLVTGEEPELRAFAFDRSKMLISVEETHLTGAGLAQILRTCYHLEVEMASECCVTAILTVADAQEGFDRLEKALLEIDAQLSERQCGSGADAREPGLQINARGITMEAKMAEADSAPHPEAAMAGMKPEGLSQLPHPEAAMARMKPEGLSQLPHPEAAMTMTEADSQLQESVPLEECPGRVAAEAVYLYPPGIPLLVPGERVPDGLPELLAKYQAMGLHVQGMADYRGEMLRCVIV